MDNVCVTMHYITFYYILLHHINYIILHYINYIILHYNTCESHLWDLQTCPWSLMTPQDILAVLYFGDIGYSLLSLQNFGKITPSIIPISLFPDIQWFLERGSPGSSLSFLR